MMCGCKTECFERLHPLLHKQRQCKGIMSQPLIPPTKYTLMMYRGDACVKIVEWKGADPLRLMRKVAKDLYDATKHWQTFLNLDSHIQIDENSTTVVD